MTPTLRIPAVLVTLWASVVLPSCTGATAPPQQVAQAQPPQQQEEFIPIDQLPPQEQLPAAPLLVGAYAFVLVMLFGYMITVSRKLTTMQREVDRLDSDLKRAGKT